mmetsp:Transcript_27244/g.51882  ORF Transcript_27244/g.51882 Transcript_27244/m.51882 type:complete len:211 (-) Transcript_27244:127-759(-)
MLSSSSPMRVTHFSASKISERETADCRSALIVMFTISSRSADWRTRLSSAVASICALKVASRLWLSLRACSRDFNRSSLLSCSLPQCEMRRVSFSRNSDSTCFMLAFSSRFSCSTFARRFDFCVDAASCVPASSSCSTSSACLASAASKAEVRASTLVLDSARARDLACASRWASCTSRAVEACTSAIAAWMRAAYSRAARNCSPAVSCS